ncbi:hypothetical protein KCP74_21335 [Salmonella enterica subsp. enterica]|nr:hypothetical protein KCP74_21335 [Salmonella enterica subsp. enterica]
MFARRQVQSSVGYTDSVVNLSADYWKRLMQEEKNCALLGQLTHIKRGCFRPFAK